MDGSGMFGGTGMFGGLGGQPTAAKANANVFGAVSFGAGQQSSGLTFFFFVMCDVLCTTLVHGVTTCLEYLEMSWCLAAVGKMSGKKSFVGKTVYC